MAGILPVCITNAQKLSDLPLLEHAEWLQGQDYHEDLATYHRIAVEAGFSAVDALATDDRQLLVSIALRA